MPVPNQVVGVMLEIVGGIAGAVLGYFLFGWVVGQGYYAPMVPGALLGLGCGLLASKPSNRRGVVCALAAVLLGLYTEWAYFPFSADRGLGYFVRHVGDLKSISLVLIAVGAAIAFYLAKDAGFSRIARRD